jgi:hypothetical protein
MTLATTPPTSSVLNAPSAEAPPAPPTPWPIFGNTYVNTNMSNSGCITVRAMNAGRSLRSTTRSRSSRAANARQLMGDHERRKPGCRVDGASGAVVSRVFIPAAPSR